MLHLPGNVMTCYMLHCPQSWAGHHRMGEIQLQTCNYQVQGSLLKATVLQGVSKVVFFFTG